MLPNRGADKAHACSVESIQPRDEKTKENDPLLIIGHGLGIDELIDSLNFAIKHACLLHA
jgi:hypothetical protein